MPFKTTVSIIFERKAEKKDRRENDLQSVGRSVTTMTEVTALIVTSMNRTSGRRDKAEAVIAVAFVSLSFFSTARHRVAPINSD